jgi:hypothetical protein
MTMHDDDKDAHHVDVDMLIVILMTTMIIKEDTDDDGKDKKMG